MFKRDFVANYKRFAFCNSVLLLRRLMVVSSFSYFTDQTMGVMQINLLVTYVVHVHNFYG